MNRLSVCVTVCFPPRSVFLVSFVFLSPFHFIFLTCVVFLSSGVVHLHLPFIHLFISLRLCHCLVYPLHPPVCSSSRLSVSLCSCEPFNDLPFYLSVLSLTEQVFLSSQIILIILFLQEMNDTLILNILIIYYRSAVPLQRAPPLGRRRSSCCS